MLSFGASFANKSLLSTFNPRKHVNGFLRQEFKFRPLKKGVSLCAEYLRPPQKSEELQIPIYPNSRTAIFWDLDNKQPNQIEPTELVEQFRNVMSYFTSSVDILAYANRHAFNWVPERVRDERRTIKFQEKLERQGLSTPDEPYRCPLCGAYFLSLMKLRMHFKSLHEREQKKKLSHIKQAKPKQKKKLLDRYRDKSLRYAEASRQVLVPKAGYGLMGELRRAGVHVRLVSDAPQAADIAMKKDMDAAIKSGQVALICIVSDDRGFSETLVWARQNGVKTAVIGNMYSLRKSADMYFEWADLISGRAFYFAEKLVREQNNLENLKDEILESSFSGDEEGDLTDDEDEEAFWMGTSQPSILTDEKEEEDSDNFMDEVPFFAKGWGPSKEEISLSIRGSESGETRGLGLEGGEMGVGEAHRDENFLPKTS